MTYDEILQLTAGIVGEQLTEKELGTLARAIRSAERGMLMATGATAVLSWMIAAERITMAEGEALMAIALQQHKEGENDDSQRVD